MLQQGQSDEQVIASFISEYGEKVLAAPTTTGFNRVAWIMPGVVFALGLFLVALVVRNWKLRPVAATVGVSQRQHELDSFRERARQETEL